MTAHDKIIANFIVLEGIDGAGTTTQINLLARKLTEKSVPHHATFEPTDNAVGKLIRTVLRGEERLDPGTLALLFAADRHEHLYNKESGILAHHAKNEIVMSDRYLFSSIAYQSIEASPERVFALNSDFPLPSHLIFLDLPVSIAMERLAARKNRDIFEVREFLETVKQSYDRTLSLFASTSMRIHRIDGTLPVDIVFQKTWEITSSLPIFKT